MTKVFLALVKAGLWEQKLKITSFGYFDFEEIYRLAQEQSVVGLVTAGLEHVVDYKLRQEVVLTFIGTTLQLEQRNILMNAYIAKLIKRLRSRDIYTLLLKGQGIAQCYERPLWRSCGDVDLFMTEDNYQKAYTFLAPFASFVDNEHRYTKHCAMTIDGWEVELHGSLRSGISRKIDYVLDDVQNNIFNGGSLMSWKNGNTQVFMPKADEYIVYVFTHILQHFYKEGIGLRQICDWCRLLWTCRGSINLEILEKSLREMRVMTEWKSFAFLAVEYLGMPVEAMPFYSPSIIWRKKARYLIENIMKVGNFGHNMPKEHNVKFVYARKFITVLGIIKNSLHHFFVFPIGSIRSMLHQLIVGFKSTLYLRGCV